MTWRIVLSGYYGFQNTGDEALLAAMLSDLRAEIGDPELVVLSRRPEETAGAHGVTSINRFDPVGVTRAIRGANLFISGGGTLLQDKTSLRSLLYYAGLALFASRSGCKLMLYANGLGPLETRIGKRIARSVLRSAQAVTLRDKMSADKLHSLFEPGHAPISGDRVRVTADPALGLHPASPERVEALMEAENLTGLQDSMVMVSLRPWPGDQHLTGALASALALLHRERGLVPVFLPLQYPGDLEKCRAAAAACPIPTRVVEGIYTPQEITGLIGRAEAVIGMRLHALILAVAAGVPCMGLIYDPKIKGFLDDLGLPVAGHVESLTADDLGQAASAFARDLGRYRDQVNAHRGGLKTLARENARIAASLLA